jgi:hypothetical protein
LGADGRETRSRSITQGSNGALSNEKSALLSRAGCRLRECRPRCGDRGSRARDPVTSGRAVAPASG